MWRLIAACSVGGSTKVERGDTAVSACCGYRDISRNRIGTKCEIEIACSRGQIQDVRPSVVARDSMLPLHVLAALLQQYVRS